MSSIGMNDRVMMEMKKTLEVLVPTVAKLKLEVSELKQSKSETVTSAQLNIKKEIKTKK